MSRVVAPWITVIGFPAKGEYVPPTVQAARHLIAGGWVPPQGWGA